MQDAPDEEAAESAVAGLEQGARELLAFTEPLRGEPGVAIRTAEALDLLGDVAAYRGDPHVALERYERAAAETNAAGLSWYAVEYEAKASGLAAQLEEYERAQNAARAALEHGAAFVPARGRARLHLRLAEVLAGDGQFAEAVEQVLDAAHWADESGEGGTLGAVPVISSAAGCSGWTGRRRPPRCWRPYCPTSQPRSTVTARSCRRCGGSAKRSRRCTNRGRRPGTG
ncbi:hypothetical protein [Streptomyces sp. NBC_01590]|uniref:hypothetical protein n=1 Tax=Streptomyces sp. NBC_01590 TaxID=2975887 RepID=UPI00386E5D3F